MEKMGLAEFRESFGETMPPAALSAHAKALWFAGKGDWEKAHDIVQDLPDPAASRIHAFLHRQEGDSSNARYWYYKAGEQMPLLNLEEEWEELATLNLR